MSKEIQYKIALNDRGDTVHVVDAVKGKDYYCPFCKGEFSLNKSGNTGKGSNRPHFSHKPNESSSSCTPESALHYTFKKDLTDLLNSYLSDKKELIINWKCTACSEQNEVNLLAKVTSTREEYNLKVCQPDIALLDSDENVIAVIEVVVTHSPEEKVLQFFKDAGIILIQVNLSSDEDLKDIDTIISTPTIVDYCLSPYCLNHERYSISRIIYPYRDTCRICYSPIEKYAIEVNSAFGVWQTKDFTEDEINVVKSMRNNIKVIPDQSTNERYPISDCINCKRRKSRNRRR